MHGQQNVKKEKNRFVTYYPYQ